MSTADLLRHGEIVVAGRLRAATNATLYCQVTRAPDAAGCVYKPISGERPLWDFPDGTLAARELAAFDVSEALGWRLVPPTVLRDDGPFGPGMCQLWVDGTGPDLVDVVPVGRVPDGWCRVLDASDQAGRPVSLVHADVPALRRMALFDAVINNADRKGGHVLQTRDGDVLGVDHGVSFHVEPKLRSVLWGWAGTPVDAAEADDLGALAVRLAGDLGDRLAALLTRAEARATLDRTRRLLRAGVFPAPADSWPSIPWPAF
jgi:uncharacterized repeat protein (TIGR03843 family)